MVWLDGNQELWRSCKLLNFVKKEGVLLTHQDGNGYYPLQWAALNNFTDTVHYVIQVNLQTFFFLLKIDASLYFSDTRLLSLICF